MKKIMTILLAAVIGIGSLGLAACSGAEKITITGSSSVAPLMRELAAAYEQKNTSVVIEVQTSDSTTGVTDTVGGKNSFGMASRKLKQEEIDNAKKDNVNLKEIQICTDGIAIVAHKDCALTDVSGDEVYNLYANGTAIGEVTGAITRESGSGTRDAFDDLIKNSEGKKLKDLTVFASAVTETNSTGNVKVELGKAKNKIGYISMGSIDDTVKVLKFGGVEPTAANVKNGSYKLSRPLMIIARNGDVSESAQKFIDFILGAEGQAIVAEDYIAL